RVGVIGLLETLGRGHRAVLEAAALVAFLIQRADDLVAEAPAFLQHRIDDLGAGVGMRRQRRQHLRRLEDLVDDKAQIGERRAVVVHGGGVPGCDWVKAGGAQRHVAGRPGTGSRRLLWRTSKRRLYGWSVL